MAAAVAPRERPVCLPWGRGPPGEERRPPDSAFHLGTAFCHLLGLSDSRNIHISILGSWFLELKR